MSPRTKLKTTVVSFHMNLTLLDDFICPLCFFNFSVPELGLPVHKLNTKLKQVLKMSLLNFFVSLFA